MMRANRKHISCYCSAEPSNPKTAGNCKQSLRSSGYRVAEHAKKMALSGRRRKKSASKAEQLRTMNAMSVKASVKMTKPRAAYQSSIKTFEDLINGTPIASSAK